MFLYTASPYRKSSLQTLTIMMLDTDSYHGTSRGSKRAMPRWHRRTQERSRATLGG